MKFLYALRADGLHAHRGSHRCGFGIVRRGAASAGALAMSLSLAWPNTSFATTVSLVTAAPSESQRNEAKTHYDKGVQLFSEARYSAAAAEFEAAYALVPDSTLLYNMALAWEEAGALDKALQLLKRYANEIPADEAEAIKGDIRTLEARIAREREEALRRSESSANVNETPAAGSPVQTQSAAANGTAPARERPAMGGPTSSEDRPSRLLPGIAGGLFALGVAGLATGLALAMESQESDDAVNDECVELQTGLICPSDVEDEQDRARSMALGADVAFGLGALAVAGGVVVLSIGIAKARKQRKATLSPTVSASRLGVVWTGRF